MENTYDEIMGRLGSYQLPGYVPVTEADIGNLEKDLGYPLPADYRVFLVKYGLTACHGYVLFHNYRDPTKVGGGVEGFFGINPQVSRDLVRKRRGMGKRLPKEVLPIADSPGGLICLSLAGKDAGVVYWWDQAEDSSSPRKNLIRVADCFHSFVSSLSIGEP